MAAGAVRSLCYPRLRRLLPRAADGAGRRGERPGEEPARPGNVRPADERSAVGSTGGRLLARRLPGFGRGIARRSRHDRPPGNGTSTIRLARRSVARPTRTESYVALLDPPGTPILLDGARGNPQGSPEHVGRRRGQGHRCGPQPWHGRTHGSGGRLRAPERPLRGTALQTRFRSDWIRP